MIDHLIERYERTNRPPTPAAHFLTIAAGWILAAAVVTTLAGAMARQAAEAHHDAARIVEAMRW